MKFVHVCTYVPMYVQYLIILLMPSLYLCVRVCLHVQNVRMCHAYVCVSIVFHDRVSFTYKCIVDNFSNLCAWTSQISYEGDLYLKIDRPAGIIDFVQKKMPEQVKNLLSC